MTQGHHPTHTSLQKHSVGDIYPLAIVGVGDSWELHDLSTGKVFCFGDHAVRRSKPSLLLGEHAAFVAGLHGPILAAGWVKSPGRRGLRLMPLGPNDTLPGTKAGFPPIQTTAMDSCTPPPADRSNWYGEAGTDADLPPLGAEVKAVVTVTEQEQALLNAYRYCLPTMRDCILTLVRKCKA